MPGEPLDVGVILLVEEELRRMLALLRTSVGDPLGKVIDPHVTLVPPTRIEGRDLADFTRYVVDIASATPTFQVRLKGAKTFRPVTDVVYAPLVEGAAECTALAAALRGGPITVPLDYEYEPHVTVAHGIGDAGLDRAARYLAELDAVFPATEILVSARAAGGPAEHWTPVYRTRLGRPSAKLLFGHELMSPSRKKRPTAAVPAALSEVRQ
jgi:2'-5' RNA ligase